MRLFLALLSVLLLVAASPFKRVVPEYKEAVRLMQKNPKEALKVLKRALKRHPDDPDLNLLAGNVAAKLKRYDDAIAFYSRVLNSPRASDTDKAKALHNIGNVYLGEKKLKEAIGSYLKSLKFHPFKETAHNLELALRMKRNQARKKKDDQNKEKKNNEKDKKNNRENKKQNQDKDRRTNKEERKEGQKNEKDKKKGNDEKKQEKSRPEKKKQKEKQGREADMTRKKKGKNDTARDLLELLRERRNLQNPDFMIKKEGSRSSQTW